MKKNIMSVMLRKTWWLQYLNFYSSRMIFDHWKFISFNFLRSIVNIHIFLQNLDEIYRMVVDRRASVAQRQSDLPWTVQSFPYFSGNYIGRRPYRWYWQNKLGLMAPDRRYFENTEVFFVHSNKRRRVTWTNVVVGYFEIQTPEQYRDLV